MEMKTRELSDASSRLRGNIESAFSKISLPMQDKDTKRITATEHLQALKNSAETLQILNNPEYLDMKPTLSLVKDIDASNQGGSSNTPNAENPTTTDSPSSEPAQEATNAAPEEPASKGDEGGDGFMMVESKRDQNKSKAAE